MTGSNTTKKEKKEQGYRNSNLATITIPTLLLIVFIAIAFFLYVQIGQQAESEQQQEYFTKTEEITLRTQDVLEEYSNFLYAGRAFFGASNEVSRDEWNAFIGSQEMEDRFPAISAAEFIQVVPAEEEQTYIDSVRADTSLVADGYPGFTVRPTAEETGEDVLYVVHYVEPLQGNEDAFGFDLYSNEARRDALELSRDTDSVVATEPITLVQRGGDQSGFLMMLPVYENGVETETLQERRQNLAGFILIVVKAKDLFGEVTPIIGINDDFRMEVSDITDGANNLFTLEGLGAEAYDGNVTMRVQVGARIWEITAGLPTSLGATLLDLVGPATIIVLGVIISFLAGISLYNSARVGRQANRVAKELTQDLSETNRLFTLATESAHIGVWQRDLVTGEVEWSREMYYLHDENTTTPVNMEKSLSFIEEEKREQLELAIDEAVHKAKETGKYAIIPELEYVATVGEEERYMYSIGGVSVNDKGEPKTLFGIVQDISDRKRNELNLQQNLGQLEETKQAMLNILEDVDEERTKVSREKEKIDAILQSIGDGVFVIDKESKIFMFNEAAEQISEVSREDAMGAPFNFVLEFVYEKDGSSRTAFVSEAMEGGRVKELPLYCALLKRDGRTTAVAATASPLKSKDDEVVGCVVVFRDIAKEREIDKSKSEFVSLASHQLRTPLSTIGWYAEMLLDGDAGEINKEQKEYLDQIYTGNQRMVELVNALLNVSRLELGTFIVEPEPAELKDIAKEAIGDLKALLEKRDITIIEKYDDVGPISVDVKLMHIILLNLLSNAAKYSEEGKQVELTITKDKTDVMINVKDDGIGIPKEQHDKMFTKLFRADNVKEIDATGTGLGLYIIKSILEHSGGEITFESAQGKGTTFHIRLPLKGMSKKKGTKALS